MLRDKIKDEGYFEKYLSQQVCRISVMKDRLTEFSDDRNKKNICFRFLADYYRDYINALYSAGKTYDEVKKAFDEYINIVFECGVSSYSDYVDTLAMAIVFDTDVSDIKLTEDYMKDKLVCLLLKEEADNSKLFYPNEYKAFTDYLEGIIDLDLFRTFMSDEWYDKCKELSWYDSHKSAENVYNGYWSWVAGACLKIKGEDNIHVSYAPCFD